MLLTGNLEGEAAPHVAGEPHIYARVLEYMVGEEGCSGLSVTSGDTYHFCVGISSGKFDFGNHGNPFFSDCLHDGGGGRDAGTFHHFVGCEYAVHRVLSLFPFYTFFVEHTAILLSDCSVVAEKNIHSFFLAEDGGAYAALTSAEYDEIF